MLKSKIYLKYFPVENKCTQFDEREKKTLCHWANIFRTEVKERKCILVRNGHRVFVTYDLNDYNEKIIVDMINKNYFNNEYLAILNAIIYRHKYNAFLSFWFFLFFRSSLTELERINK